MDAGGYTRRQPGWYGAGAFLFLLGALLSACGGGGGGSGSPPPGAAMSLSTRSVSVSATTAQPSPTATVAVNIANPAGTQLFLQFSGTQHGVSNVSVASSTAASATVAVTFQSPSSLGVGTYSDTVTVSVCNDINCTSQVGNSPQTFATQYTVTQAPPPPTATSISPSQIDSGSAAFLLTVTGTNFNSQSVVQWNGLARPTTYVSGTQINAQINAADVASPGYYPVTVSNQASGGGLSQDLNFLVVQYSVSAIAPSLVSAGAPGFSLTVTGQGLLPSSVVRWNGSPRPTTYVSASQLTAQIAASDVAEPGNVSVTVDNGSLGGTSAVLSFSIQAISALALTGITPTAVVAGNGPFVLTATGAGFTANTVIQWNGAARPTTYISANQATAQISASDVATAGNVSVNVVDGSSPASSTFTVTINPASKDAVGLQIDARHSGTVNFKSVTFPTASLWSSADLGGTPSYALIAAGKVIVTVNNGNAGSHLVALDQATGTVVWGPVALAGLCNAAYDQATVFVINANVAAGQPVALQALDAATGTVKWSQTLPGVYGCGPPPAVAGGFVYIAYGRVIALAETDGTIAWTSQSLVNGQNSSPAATADGIYVSYPDWTYDLSPVNGSRVWRNATSGGGGGGGTSVVANGTLYAANGFDNYNGTTFNAETGAPLGTYVADTMPAVSTQGAYFLQGGVLTAYSLTTNQVTWSFSGDGHLVTAPIVVNQYVFVGSASGNLYALDGQIGTVAWQTTAGAQIPAGPSWGVTEFDSGLAAGDGLLVVPAGNEVVAYTLSSDP